MAATFVAGLTSGMAIGFWMGARAGAAQLDEVYNERNRVVAALAHVFPSGVSRTDIPGWDEEWHGCVFVDLPSGQVSWHFHDREAFLFADLPAYSRPWDGHSTPEKYRRLEVLRLHLIRDDTAELLECRPDSMRPKS